MKRLSWLLALVLPAQTPAPPPPASRIQGELLPYQSVDLAARVAGFLDSIAVDRGSVVRKGEILAKLSAPELEAKADEATAEAEAIRARQAELTPRIAAAESMSARLKAAAATPGVIAAEDIVQADKQVEALRAQRSALDQQAAVALRQRQTVERMLAFRDVVAPFDGVVTARMVHPGALLGPSAGPLLRVEQVSRLRLVAAVPEAKVPQVRVGQKLTFRATAYPGETFTGVVTRPSRALDVKTRTMPVELDVANASGKLAPGMYVEVEWPAAN